MSEFLFDKTGFQIWYDLKSDDLNADERIFYMIQNINEPTFYVRPHRDHGPALISTDGREWYYIEGKLHRENGPAVISKDGYELYIVNGYYHREDGPAIINMKNEYRDITEIRWCLNGYDYLFDIWCKKLNKSEEEINFLKLKWDVL